MIFCRRDDLNVGMFLGRLIQTHDVAVTKTHESKLHRIAPSKDERLFIHIFSLAAIVYTQDEMDLTPYKCRGFGLHFDSAMADVPVAGIDRDQTLSMIRLCSMTEAVLYGDFSPRKIRYRNG